MEKMHPPKLPSSTANPILFPLNNPSFIGYLNLIAITLITASVLYLVASNWFMIPSLLRMLIPMGFLLIVTGISTLERWSDSIRHTLHTVCGMLIGLTLASIGQVYQTGADSYQLFTLWAILLTPWVIFDLHTQYAIKAEKTSPNVDMNIGNVGMFVLWSVVCQLGLWLFFSQTFLFTHGTDSYVWAYLGLMNLLTMLQFLISVTCYPKSRFIMIAGVAVIAISSSVALIFSNGNTAFINKLSFAISMFLMSGLAIAHFYHHKQQLETALSLTGLSLAIMVYLLYHIIDNGFDSFSLMLLTSAIVVFAEFALLAFLFRQLFVNHQVINQPVSDKNNTASQHHYHIILLAIGAWIAGLLFSGFMLVAWEWFSLIAGMGFLMLGITFINKNHDFFRHLGYCLAIAGQSAVTFHLADKFDNLYLLLPIQGIIFYTVIKTMTKPHWLYVALQLLASYGVLFAVGIQFYKDFIDNEHYALVALLLLNYGFYLSLHWLGSRHLAGFDLVKNNHHRSLVTAVLAVIAGSLFIYPEIFRHMDDSNMMVKAISYLLAFAWLGYFVHRFQRHLPFPARMAMILLASVLIFFGYFEIFILLMIMAWALANDANNTTDKQSIIDKPKRDGLIFSLAMLVFAWSLWQLYYHLHISFLYKSLTIFISGVLVFAFAKVLADRDSIVIER